MAPAHVLWGAVEVPGRTIAIATARRRPGFPLLSRLAGAGCSHRSSAPTPPAGTSGPTMGLK